MGLSGGRGYGWAVLHDQVCQSASLRLCRGKMAPQRERVSMLPRLQLLVLLFLPLLLVPQPVAGHGGKYSREKNEPEMAAKREPGEEFRMEKLNQLWEKAQRVSGAGKMLGAKGEELLVSKGPGQGSGVASGLEAACTLYCLP